MPAHRIRVRTQAEVEAEAEKIHEWMQARGEGAITALKTLTPNDLLHIGLVVQLHAFADLNARHGLEMIAKLQGEALSDPKKSLRESQVLPTLAERLVSLPLSDGEMQEAQRALGEIAGTAIHRHNLAHWAGRRHPDYDALVMMTKNAREVERRSGRVLQDYEWRYVIVPMPELRSQMPLLQKNVDWLAYKIQEWWDRFASHL